MKLISKNLFIVLTGLLLVTGCKQYNKVAEDLSFLTPDKFQCTVMQVYSGNSFLCQMPGLDNERIELIGVIIAAEKKKEAKKFTSSILKRGTLVKIEPGKDIRNNDGSIAAYVFVAEGRMLNILLVEESLADTNTEEINRYQSEFIEINEKQNVETIEEN